MEQSYALHCQAELGGQGRSQAQLGNEKKNLFGSGEKINISRSHRREGGFWQRRFWEHDIRDEPDFHRHLYYLHWNPVKHGYVKIPMEWPYSTIHRFVAQGFYPPNWGGGDVDEYPADNFGE